MHRLSRERPAPIILPLQLPMPQAGLASTNALKVALFESLVHHILYIRGQIAVPFRELVQTVNAFEAASNPQNVLPHPPNPNHTSNHKPSPAQLPTHTHIRHASQHRKLSTFVRDVTAAMQVRPYIPK